MASYEEIFGKDVARNIRRGAPQVTKPAAKKKVVVKKKVAPKARASAPATAARRPLGPAVPAPVQRRNVANYRKRQAAAPDPEFLALKREVADFEARKKAGGADNPLRPGTKLAGLDPSQLRGGSDGLGRIIANFGGDVIDTITGIPSAAQLGVENIAAANALVPAGLSRAGVPGLGGAERYVRRVAGLDKQAAKATVDDYKYRYGDLAKVNIADVITGKGDSRENLRKGWGKIEEHPGLFASDVAGAYSAAGAGVRMGAAAGGRVLGNEALQRIGSKSIAPGSARYRAPRVRAVEMGENTALGVKGRSIARVETPRRPYSANPISRGVQRGVGKLAEKAQRQTPGAVQRRFNRAVSTQARDYRLAADLNQTKKLRQGSTPYVRAVKELDDAGSRGLKTGGKAKWTREQVDAALFLHGRDLLDVPGMTPQAARSRVLQFMREGADDLVQGTGAKNKGAQRTMDAIASVPDELLDLANGPPELRVAVAEYRKLSGAATQGRVGAGTITPETAQAVTRRPAEQIFGESRFDPKYVPPTPRVVAARSALERAIEARDAGPRLTTSPALHRAFSAGRQAGRGERNIELARPLRGTRTTPKIPAPNDFTPSGGVRGGGRTSEVRGPGISASQGRAFSQSLRGRGRQYNVRTDLAESAKRARAVREARSELIAAEREAQGAWTPSKRTDVGARGVYTPDVPVDPMNNGRAGDPAGAFGRMTQDRVRQSHGTLFRTGNVSIDRGLPIKALERSLVDQAHPQFVKDFYDTFAFRRPNGKLSTGKRARLAMEADPDNVVLVSQKSLEDAMRLSRELPEGELPSDPLRAVQMYEGEEGLALVNQLGDKGDLVAFPKAAIEGIRQGWNELRGPKGSALKEYDNVLSYWKRGVLSFAPRYYGNSLIGNSTAYGMLTGFDLRSLFQAKRKNLGEYVPERINSSTNVNEARLHDVGRKNLTKPTAAFGRFSDRLMSWQSSFDALFRRAAYINRTKKGLRAEGVKIRGLSPEDLGTAIRTAPKEVVEQAIRETELWFGDYLRLGPMERATVRRIFPFYSFMRYAGRLTLEMPIRHPKRTALLAAMTQASTDVLNPLDPYQDNLANRGRVRAGNFAVRTAGPNTFFPYADAIRGVTSGDPKAVVGAIANNTSPIGIQQALRLYSGTSAFGSPVSAPPGYNGSYQNFGGPMMRDDPTTGTSTFYEPSVPLLEQAIQTIPLAPQIARGIASGGRQPYDTTTTLDLLSRSKPDAELFKPKRDRAMEPIPYLAPLLGWAGANVQRYDAYMDAKELRRRQQLSAKAKRSTAKRKRKAG